MTAARDQPASLESERSLLGAMLLSRGAIAAAHEECDAADFYRPVHGHIFDAIIGLYAAAEPVDSTTVSADLERRGLLESVGGATELMSLIAATPATSNAGHYARTVRRHATYRRLIAVGADVSQVGWDATLDGDEAIDQAEAIVNDIGNTYRSGRTTAHLGSTLDEWNRRVEKRGEHEYDGIATGWEHLDEMLSGLRGGQLVTVAARPSMGKSAFAGALTLNVARAGHPVLFASVEMSLAELQDRFMASASTVDLNHIRRGTVTEKDWTHIIKTQAQVFGLPIYVEDDPNLTVLTLRGAARRQFNGHDTMGLVVVDYLQLLTSTGRAENRQVEVAALSRGLKKMALELKVPVVSLAQLNRNLEIRSEKRPMLADLRESGAIENDSDVVIFLYRDEVYKPKTDRRGECDVIIAKQRNGPVGDIVLAYDVRYGQFHTLRRGAA